MRVTACSDCGRSLDGTVERYFRVYATAADERATGDAPVETVLCLECGDARLNADPSLPAGAVTVHAPTGARR